MGVKLRRLLWLALLCFAATVWAQDTGSITGTVQDKTGGVIPNATVTITNPATGVDRTTTTNAQGEYLVAGLTAGTYNMTVNATGFQKYNTTGIILRVGQKIRADATLNVGATTTEVNVSGTSVGQVETQSSEVAGTITEREVSQLELNGRNFTQLVTLAPGVSNQTGQDEGTVGVYGNVAYSINGGRTEYNNWEIDGGDNMDNGSNSTLNVYPNVDAIGEVRVLTSNYGAQYGRNGSGTVEMETKSGTNSFHGDAFEFLKNDWFNARSYFNYATGPGDHTGGRPPEKKHDYGYTFGGPIKKDKLFFFWSEEWRREKNPTSFNLSVPTTAMRSGNFSAYCPGAHCPKGAGVSATNQVTVTPQAQTLMNAFIPVPNAGDFGTYGTYESTVTTPTTWREELGRIDYNLTSNWRVFYRFVHDSWNTVTPTTLWTGASFPTVQTKFIGPGVAQVAHLTATLSPTTVNEFVASYTTDHIALTTQGPGSQGLPSNFGMGSIFNNGFGGKLPDINICGSGEPFCFAEGVYYQPWYNSNPTYTFRDSVTKNVGTHNLNIGAYYVAAQKNEQSYNDISGDLNFTPPNPISSGNAFADFLLGRISSYSQSNKSTKYYNRYKILEPYFQDDWHITPRLTLNLGVRVSLFGTYRERYKQAYNFDPTAYTPGGSGTFRSDGSITGNPFNGMVQCGANGIPAGCMQGHLFNPAPRVGFAYDVFGDGKTAIRGGYGIFFEHMNGNEANTESLEGSPPLILAETQSNISSWTSIGPGAGTIENFPLSPTAIPNSKQTIAWPYIQQWHLDLQHEILKNTVLTTSYVGSKGTHLALQRNMNQLHAVPGNINPYGPEQPLDCSNFAWSYNGTASAVINGMGFVNNPIAIDNAVACGADANPFRPFAGFGTINLLEPYANSNYNGWQTSVRRNIGALMLNLAYTWGHSIDDSSDRYDGSFVDSYNYKLTRASSNYDQRHILNVAYDYQLPLFNSGGGVLQTVLGGWAWSGITTWQTGTPFNLTDNIVSGNNAGVANGVGIGSRPDQVGNPYAVTQTPCACLAGPLWYNPSAFVAPRGLTFGNVGRNEFREPGRTNFDMGLIKNFRIKESQSLVFRAEAFNIFNHTQFTSIDNTDTDTKFLRPTSSHLGRVMQFGLKYVF